MHTIRIYTASDRAEWGRMRTTFWPDQVEADMDDWLSRADAVVLVAERDGGGLCGFAEVGARRYADGCLTSPVAYLEGWYVDADARDRGVGSALVEAAFDWARAQGYTEMASDVLLDNLGSQRAHLGLGFEEVERAIHYRRDL